MIRLTFGTVGAGGGYDDTKCNLIALISYESTTSLFISSCILTLVTQSRQQRPNLIPHLFGVYRISARGSVGDLRHENLPLVSERTY